MTKQRKNTTQSTPMQKSKPNKAKPSSNPISFNPLLRKSAPSSSRVAAGKDIIVSDYTVLSSFSASDYALNPRLEDKFPSANLTAQRYDMYQFEELAFHWFPTTAVTTSPGIVFLGWEPNANSGPPTTVTQINAFEHHIQTPVYKPVTLRIPKNFLGPPRYTRSGPTGSDLNFYDTGRLIVASDHGDSKSGYVEVTYRIRFFNYHLERTTMVQSRLAEARRITTDQTFAAGTETTVEFNSLGEDFNGDDSIALASNGQITLPAGKYQVWIMVHLQNQVNEATVYNLYLEKDGATPVPDVFTQMSVPGVGALSTLHLQAVIDSNGTSVFRVRASMAAATGPCDLVTGSRISILALS